MKITIDILLQERAQTCIYCRRVLEELVLGETPPEETLALGLVALSRVLEEQQKALLDAKLNSPPPTIIITTQEHMERIRKEVPSA